MKFNELIPANKSTELLNSFEVCRSAVRNEKILNKALRSHASVESFALHVLEAISIERIFHVLISVPTKNKQISHKDIEI